MATMSRAFSAFSSAHLGGAVSEKALAETEARRYPRLHRAIAAAKAWVAGGVQRALAAVRSFYKFLAREGILENAAPRAIRTPRVKRRSLPRPLSVDDAARVHGGSGRA